MRRGLLFLAKHLLALAVFLAAAAGAGTLAIGPRFSLALRSALGLALWAHALFLLALIGQLTPVPILILLAITLAAAAVRIRPLPSAPPPSALLLLAFCVLLFLVALAPPIAFDETLYHLPIVRALATSGQLRVLPDVRFAVFPQLHELLCVPMFLLVSDVATHLVSLAELMIAAALVFDWGRRSGALAVALLLGSPIVLHLATIAYVDAALMLFVTAGFCCLDREQPILSGVFLGTACSVKYLGGYFAVAALLIYLFRDRKRVLAFAASCAAAALPTTLWLAITTGDPLYPFLTTREWFTPSVAPTRLLWDVTFARERVNYQPPMTSLLILMIAVILVAAIRDARARIVLLICAGYVAVFAFLPQDSRYLLPLLPLICITAATAIGERWRWLPWLAVAPGAAYAVYRLTIVGLPPADREAWLRKRVPAYAAVVRAGDDRIYACGGEQLKYYARGEFLGDPLGPNSYTRIVGDAQDGASIAARLQPLGVQSYLVVKGTCPRPAATGGMELVYEDAAAQLWRVVDAAYVRR
ncbi:MAG TPA: hypothetical protein VKB93_06495 [Thermoanaerobaculia bacterium]|nr:hypothetical protein [Thermoanaerobaculia bacterium]